MKKLLALVVVAVALGWGAVLLDFGADASDPATDGDDSSAEPRDAREPGERRPSKYRKPTDPGAEEPTDPSEPERPPPAENRHHPEFLELGQLYATEPRDGDWALAHEERLKALLRGAETRRSVHIHCRATVCRLTVEAGSQRDLIEVLDLEGVRALTYLSEESPYSLEGGSLTVYYRRTGDPEPDALP